MPKHARSLVARVDVAGDTGAVPLVVDAHGVVAHVVTAVAVAAGERTAVAAGTAVGLTAHVCS